MKVKTQSFLKRGLFFIGVVGLLPLFQCRFTPRPESVEIGKEQCHSCKMTLVDHRFIPQAVTDKGKVFKFDSFECLMDHLEHHSQSPWHVFVTDHKVKNEYISAETAVFWIHPSIKSPMGKGILAAKNIDSFKEYPEFNNSGQKVMTWKELQKKLKKSSALD